MLCLTEIWRVVKFLQHDETGTLGSSSVYGFGQTGFVLLDVCRTGQLNKARFKCA